MHALCCPDKFRGTLTAAEAAGHMATGLRAAGLEARELPLADGGEGTLEVIVASRGGRFFTTRVTGPLGDLVDAAWALLEDGTAIVEAATAAGLALVAVRNDPVAATTAGVGELIAAAAAEGAERALVCVGGSATTDGGLGAVESLGWSLHGLEVTVLCDVGTAFRDAAVRFAPQKGATPEQVPLLTARLDALADRYRRETGVDVSDLPGAGAAGGLAGGLAALGASLRSGFDAVADAVGLDDALGESDAVVTGEGRLDATSFHGKVVGAVLARRPAGLAAAVVAGHVAPEAQQALPRDVVLRSLADRAKSLDEAMARAPELLVEAAREVGSVLLSG